MIKKGPITKNFTIFKKVDHVESIFFNLAKKYLKWTLGDFKGKIWPLIIKITVSSGFLSPKMYRKWCNLLFRLSLDFLLNFKMAAILNFENANKQTIREKSDIDSKHIKITPLKFASIYFFISFRYIKNQILICYF